MKILLWLPLLVWPLAAADVSGQWSGTVEVADPSSGNRIETRVRATMRQTGSAVTAKIGRTADAGAQEQGEGKLEGNVLTFAIKSAEGAAPFRFRLVLSGVDRLEGDMEGAVDTGKIAGKVRLTRDAAR